MAPDGNVVYFAANNYTTTGSGTAPQVAASYHYGDRVRLPSLEVVEDPPEEKLVKELDSLFDLTEDERAEAEIDIDKDSSKLGSCWNYTIYIDYLPITRKSYVDDAFKVITKMLEKEYPIIIKCFFYFEDGTIEERAA